MHYSLRSSHATSSGIWGIRKTRTNPLTAPITAERTKAETTIPVMAEMKERITGMEEMKEERMKEITAVEMTTAMMVEMTKEEKATVEMREREEMKGTKVEMTTVMEREKISAETSTKGLMH